MDGAESGAAPAPVLTDGQAAFVDLVESGENVYLAGVGGTGKSYAVEEVIARLRDGGSDVVVCAPTGIAALNVGGSTIHRVLGIRPDRTMTRDDPWIPDDSPLLVCDTVVVDEVSMCRLDLFDYLSRTLRKAARLRGYPVQLVVVGDFSQLPPVVPKCDREPLEDLYGYDVGGGYAFMGEEWERWGFVRCELTEVVRQRDADFARALCACRDGDASGLSWIEGHASPSASPDAVYICGRNYEADRKNESALAGIDRPSRVYRADVGGAVGKGDMPTAVELELKRGARVMALVNEEESGYMNGSTGTVLECRPGGVEVSFDDGAVALVGRHEWEITRPVLVDGAVKSEVIGSFTQVPLRLAYALTVHKSQGQTFDAVSVSPVFWYPGQLYTALSRVRSVDGLHLRRSCPRKSLITSPDVARFYDGLPHERRDRTVEPEQRELDLQMR